MILSNQWVSNFVVRGIFHHRRMATVRYEMHAISMHSVVRVTMTIAMDTFLIGLEFRILLLQSCITGGGVH